MATLSKAALPVPAWIVASPVNAGEWEQAKMGGQSHLCPATPPYRGTVWEEPPRSPQGPAPVLWWGGSGCSSRSRNRRRERGRRMAWCAVDPDGCILGLMPCVAELDKPVSSGQAEKLSIPSFLHPQVLTPHYVHSSVKRWKWTPPFRMALIALAGSNISF